MAEPVKIGGELVVNAEQFSQTSPSIAYLSTGGFVVTWVDPTDGDGAGIAAQPYDGAGNKVGGPFQVNSLFAGSQVDPQVTALASGNFVVAWRGPGGSDPDANGIRGQLFNSSGDRIGSEFLINTTVAGDQQGQRITALASGDFLVTWLAAQTGNAVQDLRPAGQIFSASGAKVGAELHFPDKFSDVSGLPSGGFVATWIEIRDGAYVVSAQRYGSNGSPDGGAFEVARTASTSANVMDARVQTLSDGGFAIAWVERLTVGSEPSQQDIRARIYGANGLPVGDAFTINNFVAGSQNQVELAALGNGAFVVTWTDTSAQNADTDRFGIMAQVVDGDGNLIGSEILVNTKVAGIQQNPDVTALPSGRFAISWQDQVPNMNDYDIRAQIFSVETTGGAILVRGTEGDDHFVGTIAQETFVLLGGNDSVLYGSAAAVTGDLIDGGSGSDEVVLRGEMSGGVEFGLRALTDVEAIRLVSARDPGFPSDASYHSYNITLRGGNVAAGQTMTIDGTALRFGEALIFDAINENEGSFRILGGGSRDFLFGSNNGDYIRGGLVGDYLAGNGGDDIFFYGSAAEVSGDTVDGGAGNDQIVMRGNLSGGVSFGVGSLESVESILLTSANDPTYGPIGGYNSYNITLAGTLSSGETRTIDGSGLAFGEALFLDAINENEGSLEVLGGASRDFLSGTNQGDTMKGGLGGDYLAGNGGSDIFVYGGAANSTSLNFDTLAGFDRRVDTIDLPGSASGHAGTVGQGRLAFATFDADLSAAMQGFLGPNQVALFNPNTGDFAGRAFAIVDLNGQAGYQAGADLVLEFLSPAVPLGPNTDYFI